MEGIRRGRRGRRLWRGSRGRRGGGRAREGFGIAGGLQVELVGKQMVECCLVGELRWLS